MRRRGSRQNRRRAPCNEPDPKERRLKEAKLIPVLRAGSQKNVRCHRPARVPVAASTAVDAMIANRRYTLRRLLRPSRETAKGRETAHLVSKAACRSWAPRAARAIV